MGREERHKVETGVAEDLVKRVGNGRYVRIKFLPAGGARRVSWWAISKGNRRGPNGEVLRVYLRVDQYGDTEVEPGRTHLVITGEHEVEEKPAGMSKKYGWLMLYPKEEGR